MPKLHDKSSADIKYGKDADPWAIYGADYSFLESVARIAPGAGDRSVSAVIKKDDSASGTYSCVVFPLAFGNHLLVSYSSLVPTLLLLTVKGGINAGTHPRIGPDSHMLIVASKFHRNPPEEIQPSPGLLVPMGRCREIKQPTELGRLLGYRTCHSGRRIHCLHLE